MEEFKMAGQLKYKDQTLAYQPFQGVLNNFEKLAQSKNIQLPFSEKGFESVLQVGGLKDTLVSGLASLFKGSESYISKYQTISSF